MVPRKFESCPIRLKLGDIALARLRTSLRTPSLGYYIIYWIVLMHPAFFSGHLVYYGYIGWVAKWSNAVDCKSATTVSQVRILPQPLGHRY